MAIAKDYVELLAMQALAAPAIVKSAEQNVATYLSVTLVTWFVPDSTGSPSTGFIFQFEGNLDDTGDSGWFTIDQVQSDTAASFNQTLDNNVSVGDTTIVDGGGSFGGFLPLLGYSYLKNPTFGLNEWVRAGRVNDGVSFVTMDPVTNAHAAGQVWRNMARVTVQVVPLESVKRLRAGQ